MSSIGATLAQGIAFLRASSESPRSDALQLLVRTLERDREWILAHDDASTPAQAARAFAAACERRRTGVPIAQIVGSAGFYGREFLVDENVLVPRPETEHLIDEALAFIGNRPCEVLDVGTGSGAIACTIAAETSATVTATDISAAAIAIAKENAEHLGVTSRCSFFHGDLTEPIDNRRFDVVVANLPYVPTADIPKAPNPVAFEPRVAVDGGPDGLGLYRRLLPALVVLLKPESIVLLEAAPPTIAALTALAKASLPNFTIEIRRDYAGLERYLRAQRGGVRPG